MMKYLFIILLFSISTNSFNQTSSLDVKIKQLIEIQGSKEIWTTTMNQLITIEKEFNPNLSDEYLHRFEKVAYIDAYNAYCELVIPIYKKNFTESEIDDLINFYNSDIGKAVIKKTPLLIQESMDIGKKLGEVIVENILKEIEPEKKINKNSDKINCKNIITGKFVTILPDKTVMIIDRTKKYQKENHKGDKTKYRVNWINNCTYTLEIIKSTDDKYFEFSKGKTLVINIYEVNDKYYKYSATIDGENEQMEGIMYKMIN